MRRILFASAVFAACAAPAAAFDFGTKVHFKGSDDAARLSGNNMPLGVSAAPAPFVPNVALPAGARPASAYPPPRLPVGQNAAERRAAANAVGPTSSPPPGCWDCNQGSAANRNHAAGVPNAIVTFLHPYTNKAVSVPMTMPVGKPKLITRDDRIIYDYGSFGWLGRYIVVRFFPDGGVRVNYH